MLNLSFLRRNTASRTERRREATRLSRYNGTQQGVSGSPRSRRHEARGIQPLIDLHRWSKGKGKGCAPLHDHGIRSGHARQAGQGIGPWDGRARLSAGADGRWRWQHGFRQGCTPGFDLEVATWGLPGTDGDRAIAGWGMPLFPTADRGA